MNVEVFTPTEYYGAVMELVNKRRGIFKSQDYPARTGAAQPGSAAFGDDRGLLRPAQIGHQGLCLDGLPVLEYRPDKMVKLEILVNEERWMPWR